MGDPVTGRSDEIRAGLVKGLTETGVPGEVAELMIEAASAHGKLMKAERELVAERVRADRLQAAVTVIDHWARTIHGGTVAPIDVWPGLRDALESVSDDLRPTS